MQYADVAVARRIGTRETLLTYSISPELLPSIQVGMMVEVPFRATLATGIVTHFRRSLPKSGLLARLKPIRRLLSPWPVLLADDLAFRLALADQTAAGRSLTLTEQLPPRSLLKQLEAPQPPARLLPTNRLFELGAATNSLAYLLPKIRTVLDKGFSVSLIAPTSTMVDILYQLWQKHLSGQVEVFRPDGPVDSLLPIWQAVFGKTTKLIIGPRSTVLLPFRRLGLTIIDSVGHPQLSEEQAPYYEAFTAARLRLTTAGGSLIARSSLPPLDLLGSTQRRLWQFRGREQPLPRIIISQYRSENLFSPAAEESIEKSRTDRQRVVVVVRDHGGARGSICKSCGLMQRCHTCQTLLVPLDAPSTGSNQSPISCSKCQTPLGAKPGCLNCHSFDLKSFGRGTELWQKIIGQHFPGLQVEIMARATAVPQNWQLLVVAPSWLQLPPVEADRIIVIKPEDFLASSDFFGQEDWHRLLLELRNRARLELIIETTEPEQAFFSELTELLPRQMIRTTLAERRAAGYPPYGNVLFLNFTASTTAQLAKLGQTVRRLVTTALPEATFLGPLDTSEARNPEKMSAKILVKFAGQLPTTRLRELREHLPSGIRMQIFPAEHTTKILRPSARGQL